MKSRTKLLIAASIVSLVSTGCSTGYTKIDGEWTYIIINEAVGREVRKMQVDNASFRILDDPVYAADKTHVYKFGLVLDGIDGASFQFYDGNHYARDSRHIYYLDSVVLDADPKTFKILENHYARDAASIYCGSLRMNVDDPDSFKVLKERAPFGGTGYFRSTGDLVERLGDEFENHRVLYDRNNPDPRYIVTVPQFNTATDGIWMFEGPKRARRAK